jgi:hypothetical protein
MGGAFIEITGKSKIEVEKKMDKEMEKARKQGLLDQRGMTEIEWDWERQLFVQQAWVHS